MNRPNKKDFISGNQIEFPQEYSKYVGALENYCTHLETEIENDFFQDKPDQPRNEFLKDQ